jgi:hypothetical protein
MAALLLGLVLTACSSGGGTTQTGSSTTTPVPSSASTAAASCAPVTTAPGGNGAKEVNDPGDIPDNQAFVPYAPPTGGLTVKVPEGWARTEAGGESTFSDKFNSVRLEVVPAAATPTVASATTAEVPALAAKGPCFEAGKVTVVHRKGGDAVLVTYRVDSPPDPVTGKVVREAVERYEFWRNGKEAVLTLSGAVGADNVDPWKVVSDSFTWQ